jgi:hypothetical protein
MFRSTFRVGALVSVIAVAFPQAGSGQSGQSQEQAQPATQPQAPPPSGSQAGGTPNAAAKTEPGKAKKLKRVWTEEDMSKLDGKVSVVGESNSAVSGNAPSNSGSRDASSYRNRLAPLRQQLERIDAQIRDLRNAKVGGRDNIARPLERLETQKKGVQEKIDAIEDEARKNGVEPGQLR